MVRWPLKEEVNVIEETAGRLRQQPRRTPVRTDAIRAALAAYRINPSEEHVKSFAIRLRERQMHDVTDHPALQVGESAMDILRFIKEARDDGAVDEALWRAFLAAHFGIHRLVH
jgi:hypothetical protein